MAEQAPAMVDNRNKRKMVNSAMAGHRHGRPPKRGRAPTRTIFVSFPTPSTVTITWPFYAYGTNDPNTTMNATAEIWTPTDTLIGNLVPAQPPFTWCYEFDDPIPTGVPLALIVRGVNAQGQTEEVIVPFQGQ
jgi:hypothetical protein